LASDSTSVVGCSFACFGSVADGSFCFGSSGTVIPNSSNEIFYQFINREQIWFFRNASNNSNEVLVKKVIWDILQCCDDTSSMLFTQCEDPIYPDFFQLITKSCGIDKRIFIGDDWNVYRTSNKLLPSKTYCFSIFKESDLINPV
jgi:hypothetical protein